MNAYRASIAVAVLAAFAGGIALGSFLNSNGTSDNETTSSRFSPSEKTGGLSTSQDSRLDSGSRQFTDQSGAAISGSDVVLRLWSALTHPDENTRHLEWLSLMPSLSAADAREVREHFRRMKAQGRHFQFEWEVFWQRWGELDGAAAIEEVRVNEPEHAEEIAGKVLRGWAKKDPAAAREWLAANSTTPFRESAVQGYIAGLARQDLARATQDALAFGSRNFENITNLLVEEALMQGNTNGMLEWWRSLPGDGSGLAARRAAISPIISRLQEISPERAQAWLTELAGTTYRDDEQLGAFAGRLARTDPASAVSWVTSLPTTQDGKYIGIGRTTKAWAAKDKAGFDNWLAGIPQSPLRDQVVSAQQQKQQPAAAQWVIDSSSFDLKMNDAITILQDATTKTESGVIKSFIRVRPSKGDEKQ